MASGVRPFEINTGDQRLTKCKMRPCPLQARKFLKEEILKLLKIGAIREVRWSEYGVPVRMVEKPDGSWRVCIDYRWLNQITMIPQYPLPRLEDLVIKIKGKRFLAAIDLTKAYWQMPVKREDQMKTTFTSEFGNFEYLWVPMGISGAVAYYQSEVHEILGQIDLDNEHQFIEKLH